MLKSCNSLTLLQFGCKYLLIKADSLPFKHVLVTKLCHLCNCPNSSGHNGRFHKSQSKVDHFVCISYLSMYCIFGSLLAGCNVN